MEENDTMIPRLRAVMEANGMTGADVRRVLGAIWTVEETPEVLSADEYQAAEAAYRSALGGIVDSTPQHEIDAIDALGARLIEWEESNDNS